MRVLPTDRRPGYTGRPEDHSRATPGGKAPLAHPRFGCKEWTRDCQRAEEERLCLALPLASSKAGTIQVSDDSDGEEEGRTNHAQ